MWSETADCHRTESRYGIVCVHCGFEVRAETVEKAAEWWNRCIAVPEVRYNPYHDPKTGKFTSAPGGVDKTSTSGIIKTKSSSMKIGKREYIRLCHEIATDFPTLRADGRKYIYENRNHIYSFSVIEFGNYEFHSKEKLK